MKRTPLKRKTRLRPMSTKRQREAKIYSQKRKAFLEAHPLCQAHGMIMVCLGFRHNTTDYYTGLQADRRSTDIHHVKRRIGANYLDEKTWLAVCRWSHNWIHANPKDAKSLGLLA